MKKQLIGAAAAVLFLASSPAAAGELKLTLSDGRATLIATDVTLRQILDEWARVGKTTIVNGDKMTGAPLSLQLVDLPEREVLEVLLRTASGYIVAPRPVSLANASAYDRILIMPTSRPPAATASNTPSPFNRNAQPQPMPQPMPQPDVDDPIETNPNPGPQPMNQPGMPPQMNQPGPQNQAPMTAPRPGMLPAPQPGQPNPYGTNPPLPPGVRPPGGGGGGQ
jgi:hypothetical protein